ncbi:hypothetical protein CVT26_006558 [Gymnopilus dilepis]|uniref:Uncharacterized protein n=1 Tax=Gymnopilus dilepis TaxID=231916 RepID=A0A409W610_9AGAR|nr:hypothetical protein CVT26_006558 [Gymnopilus dilepis]
MPRFLSPTAIAHTRGSGSSRLRSSLRALSTAQDEHRGPRDHARMWNWDHPDDIVCPGDPHAAWYIVNADGLLFPRTQSEIQAFDFSIYNRVEITHNPSWRDAVGFYRSYYHARRRRLELSSFDLDLGFPLSSPYHTAPSTPLTPASESGTVSPPLPAESEEPTEGDPPPQSRSLPTADEDDELDPMSLAMQTWSDVRLRSQPWGGGELRPIEAGFWTSNTATVCEAIASHELERARSGRISPQSANPARPPSFRRLEMDSESEEGDGTSDKATDGSASRSTSQELDSDSESEMDNQERERRRAGKSKSRKRSIEDDDDDNDNESEESNDDDDGEDDGSWDDDDKKRYIVPRKAKEPRREDMVKVVKKLKLRGGQAGTKIICWRPKVIVHDSETEGPSSYGAGPSYPRPSSSQSAAGPSTSAVLDMPSPAPQLGSSSRSSTPTPGSSSRAATPPESSSRSPTPVPQPSGSAAGVASPSDAAPPSPASSAASSTDGMFEDYSPKEIALIDIILKKLT